MLDDGEPALLRHLVLAPLDLGIGEFLDASALQADEMVVMLAVFEFEYRLAGLEMMALQQADLLELGEHAIYRGQADVEILGHQLAINILGGQVTLRRLAKQVEDRHARHGRLEADALEFCAVGHGVCGAIGLLWALGVMWPYDIVFALNRFRRPAMLARALLPSLLLLSACSNTPEVTSYLTPYRIDVRQGNYVTQEMVAKLKLGMTREQVRFALGTPLVADLFHASRWDYIYSFQPGRGEAQQRRLVVFFEDNKLIRVGGDVTAETEATAAAPTAPAARVLEVPAEPKKD